MLDVFVIFLQWIISFFFFPSSLKMTKDQIDDIRIQGFNALLTPSFVKEEFPLVRSTLYVDQIIY